MHNIHLECESNHWITGVEQEAETHCTIRNKRRRTLSSQTAKREKTSIAGNCFYIHGCLRCCRDRRCGVGGKRRTKRVMAQVKVIYSFQPED